jgi:hypothetical protein
MRCGPRAAGVSGSADTAACSARPPAATTELEAYGQTGHVIV